MSGSATAILRLPTSRLTAVARIGRKNRSCQTISHSQVVMDPITGPRSRIAYCAGDGEGPTGGRGAGRRRAAGGRRPGPAAPRLEAVPRAGGSAGTAGGAGPD